MKLKAIPLLSVLVLGAIKLPFVISAGGRDNVIGWVLISLWFAQITWAYWKDKDMLAPPNFNFKNGGNSLPRAIYVITMLGSYLMGVIFA